MQTNQEGIRIIKQAESLRLKSYLCPADVWTIGYGTTRIDGEPVTEAMMINEVEAEKLLMTGLPPIESYIRGLGLVLNIDQFSALVSLIYNIGSGNFGMSTLLKVLKENLNNIETINISKMSGGVLEYLNEDEITDLGVIEYNFLRWCMGGGMPLRGLYIRRKAEYKLFIS